MQNVNSFMKEKQKFSITEDRDVLIVSYKDDATAFNGQKKEQLEKVRLIIE